jgi:hypothetical protein
MAMPHRLDRKAVYLIGPNRNATNTKGGNHIANRAYVTSSATSMLIPNVMIRLLASLRGAYLPAKLETILQRNRPTTCL